MSCYIISSECSYKNCNCNECPYSKPPKNKTSGTDIILTRAIKNLEICEKEIEKHKDVLKNLENERKSLIALIKDIELMGYDNCSG